MKRKRNIIKRNSGFVVGCVAAAGVSFFGSDILMSRYFTLDPGPAKTVEETTEAELAPEKAENRTYETDAFTVTASGSVIKGVESERTAADPEPDTEPEETDAESEQVMSDEVIDGSGAETDPVSDADDQDAEIVVDSEIEPGYSNGSGSSTGGSSGSGSSSSTGGSSSSGGSSSTGGSSSSGGSGSTGGSSGSSSDDSGPNIIIQDPGNGDYTYNDSGSGSSSSGSGSSSSDSGSSSSGSESPWTPDDVMLWGISSRYISESELYNFDTAQIRVLRNEILALNGRIFQSQDLIDYFSQKSWYTPIYSPEEFDANMFYYLNDYEEANLQVILDYEAALWGY